jgi:hypothetical protein
LVDLLPKSFRRQFASASLVESDRTWAAVLVLCTLGLCWYFA